MKKLISYKRVTVSTVIVAFALSASAAHACPAESHLKSDVSVANKTNPSVLMPQVLTPALAETQLQAEPSPAIISTEPVVTKNAAKR